VYILLDYKNKGESPKKKLDKGDSFIYNLRKSKRRSLINKKHIHSD